MFGGHYSAYYSVNKHSIEKTFRETIAYIEGQKKMERNYMEISTLSLIVINNTSKESHILKLLNLNYICIKNLGGFKCAVLLIQSPFFYRYCLSIFSKPNQLIENQ